MGDDEQYWYNLVTHEVERGMRVASADRSGPYATAEEAARAPEIMAARSRQWSEDDAREDDWPQHPATGDATDTGE